MWTLYIAVSIDKRCPEISRLVIAESARNVMEANMRHPVVKDPDTCSEGGGMMGLGRTKYHSALTGHYP